MPAITLRPLRATRRCAKERTAAVVRKAAENRRSVFKHKLAERDTLAQSVAQEWQQERVRERLEWLYTYDATAVEV
jgi:salicylate hydroxylase